MKQLMEDFKEKRLVSNQHHELLAHTFLLTKQVMLNIITSIPSWYSLETKQFAVTLHLLFTQSLCLCLQSSCIA